MHSIPNKRKKKNENKQNHNKIGARSVDFFTIIIIKINEILD